MRESRLAEEVAYTPRPAGATSATIRCPFCDTVTEVRTWSLAGSGKKCECGALLHGYGRRYMAHKNP